ncbi:hypothetical protein B0H14DRAFT_2876145 [Mycena olivaceomarginata]|nr:hypothetical protein B0H14DRAFT_2876145 [Mycena olivaceomarginata]
MWERRRRLPSMESASAATSLCSVTTASAESLNFDDVTPRTSLETCSTSLGGFSASTGTDCAALSSTRMAPAELRFTADRPALTVHPRAGPVRLVGRGGQGSVYGCWIPGTATQQPRLCIAVILSSFFRCPAATARASLCFTAPAAVVEQDQNPGQQKSSSEAPETVRSSKFPWKGKGKATGNASTYGAPSLTRTDTMDTTSASLVDFLPAHRARQAYQSTMAQDFILEPIPASNLSTEVAALVSTLRRRHQDKTRERSHAGPVFLALRLRLLHAIRRTPGTPTKRYADMGIQPLAHLRYFPIRLTTHNPKVCHTTVIVPMTTPSYAPSPPRARSPSYASHQTRRMTIISMIICTAPPPQLPLQSTSISQCRSNLSMIQDLRASLLTV